MVGRKVGRCLISLNFIQFSINHLMCRKMVKLSIPLTYMSHIHTTGTNMLSCSNNINLKLLTINYLKRRGRQVSGLWVVHDSILEGDSAEPPPLSRWMLIVAEKTRLWI